MNLEQEGDEGVTVGLPQIRQLGGWRVLAAGQLQGQLVATGPHVVVVLHPTCSGKVEGEGEDAAD